MKAFFLILFSIAVVAAHGQPATSKLFTFLNPSETGISFRNEIKENEAENEPNVEVDNEPEVQVKEVVSIRKRFFFE